MNDLKASPAPFVESTFEPRTEIGRRIIGHPDAATFFEIRQLALYMASLWEAVAGSAERFDSTILRYECLNIRAATREAFELIKTVTPAKGGDQQ